MRNLALVSQYGQVVHVFIHISVGTLRTKRPTNLTTGHINLSFVGK